MSVNTPLVFKDSCFFEKTSFFWKTSFIKSLLPFVTLVNYERACPGEGFLHILCSYFDVALAQLESSQKQKRSLLK